MSSFHCLLFLDGQQYPVVHCSYEFTQPAAQRGRATAKVRSGLLGLHLDVPDGDQLLAWACNPLEKKSGQLVFQQIDSPVPSEVLQFAEAFCVSYEEAFMAGSNTAGAYRCALQLTAGQLQLDAVAKDSNWAHTR